MPRGNKQQLADLLNTAEKLKANDYTPGSFAKLTEVLQPTRNVLNDVDATQDAVTKATDALSKALQQLIKQPNKAELVNVITKAAELKETDYTPASFADLKRH